MKPNLKAYPDGFLEKLIQMLGDKVYSIEELIPIFQTVDKEFGLDRPKIRMHVTCVWKCLMANFPEFVMETQEGTGAQGKKSYLVSEPTKVVNLLQNPHRTKSRPKAEKVVVKCKVTTSKKTKKEGPKTIEVDGRTFKQKELPKLVLSNGVGELTPNDHEALWLTAGLITLSHKGLAAKQVADLIHKNRMAVDENAILALVKRDSNFELDRTIIRLKRDEKGSTIPAWQAIDAAHNPSQFKKTLMLRTSKSKENIKKILGSDVEIKLISDQQMAGALWELKVPGNEESLLRVAQIYGTVVLENGDFLWSEDEEYFKRVEDTWDMVIRARLQATLEYQIRRGEINDALRN